MTFLGLKQGQDLENRAVHPHQEFSGVALPPPPPEYCHTKNIETIGNLVYASKDDRKKKREIFVKKPRNICMSSVGARYTIKSL